MRRNGILALARGAAAIYIVTLILAPAVDRSLDVGRSFPEDYAFGPAGPMVRLGYVMVAVSWLGIAVALSPRRVGTAIGAILLAAAAALSLVLAVVPQQVSGGPLLVGVLGLVAAPLWVTLATRGQAGPFAAPLVALALTVLAGSLALVTSSRDVAGLVNRSWDVALATWSLVMAQALTRRAVSPAAAAAG